MDVHVDRRPQGDVPWGTLLMASLTALPFGAWLVEQGWLAFGTCGMKQFVGLPCMMCGSTRATIHLLRGDLVGALSFQPMTIVAYVGIVLWGMVSFIGFCADRRIHIQPSERDVFAIKVALVVLPIVNWIYLISAGI